MLGPCWLAAILAGSLMSLAKLAAWGQPQYVAATAVLALLGLALLVFLQAVSPPGAWAASTQLTCAHNTRHPSQQQLYHHVCGLHPDRRCPWARAATGPLQAMPLHVLCACCAAAAGPGRVMGILAVLIYGIMVTLSTLYPDLSSMWVGAVVMLVLGMAVAAVVAMLVGFLVVPSLASDEVRGC